MAARDLPETVRQAWGQEAAQDFIAWLETKLASEVQISAQVARQKVNVLILERVSNLMLADEPSLEQDEKQQWVWRVPVDITLPRRGRIGCVGEVLVDAQRGEVRYTQALLDRMAAEAQKLVAQLSTQ